MLQKKDEILHRIFFYSHDCFIHKEIGSHAFLWFLRISQDPQTAS